MHRKATVLDKLEQLLKQPCFTSQAAKKIGVSVAMLSYHVKTGKLLRLGRGIYHGVDAPTVTDFRWEDLASAVSIVRNGVICLVSALALYELTDEIPRQHWIAVRNDTRHRASTRVKVVRMRNVSLGKTSIRIGKISLPIFDRERTLVDAFRTLGKETAIKALRLALSKRGSERIDVEKLRQYAKTLRVNIEPYLLAVST